MKISRPVVLRKSVAGMALWLSILLLAAPSVGLAEIHYLKLGGTGGDLGTMRQLARAFEAAYPEFSVEVLPSLGSGGGVKAVLAGAIDLGLTSRPLSDEERAAGAVEVAYAEVPLAPVTSRDNSESGISTAELIAIYDGRKSAWNEGRPIRLILRPRDDSDTRMLIAFIPEIAPAYDKALKRRGMPIALSDQEAADLVQSSRGALAMMSLSVVLGEARPLKVLSLDGVAPTAENIADGSYTMVKRLFFVTGTTPSEKADRFMAFVRSEEGSDLLKRTGHRPLGAGEAQ